MSRISTTRVPTGRIPTGRLAAIATGVVMMSACLASAASGAQPSVLASEVNPAQCEVNPDTPKQQMRAMWIASVANLDWPSGQGLSASQQQVEFRSQLDLAEQHNMNAVIVQIRPMADAFWPSPYEPWSQYLTGTQGGNPGYDPLAFMVAETHARGLEFHAWFNPYRVATHTNLNQLHLSHPARQNPSWVFAYNGGLTYNPGIPAVRQFIQDAMMHAVNNYDIDAVHWDDYFYPYPVTGVPIPDQATYNQHGGGFDTIEDWRRNNVDLLVQEMGEAIKSAKPHVKFGISPFGIWRNQSTDPNGSATAGLQSYDAIYADTRKWVLEEWIDYINPQIYWYIGFEIADYAVLVPWWSDVVEGTDVQLYVGQAVYRVGEGGPWNDPDVLTNHLYLNRDHNVAGDVHFRAGSVRNNTLGAFGRLSAEHYSGPALRPPMPHLAGTTPGAPAINSASWGGGGVTLTIAPGSGSPSWYAVYRVDGDGPGDPCDFEDAQHLLGTVWATGSSTTFADPSVVSGQTYTYYATALDRAHRESVVSAPSAVSEAAVPWSMTVDSTDPARFTASARWGTSSFNPNSCGSSYRFAEPEPVSDPAWWRFDIPSNGTYLVEVCYPADPGYNNAAPYLVTTDTGIQVINVNQRVGSGQWRSLGTFALAEGDNNVVGLSRWTSGAGYVIADAVRITNAG